MNACPDGKFIIIIGVLIPITLCQEYDDLGDMTPRPMPPEFDFGPEAKINKTELEEDIEECMEDYVECVKADRKREICAMNDHQKKKKFHSLCLMEYENCKIKDGDVHWRYFMDDHC
ncbi:unnamed protein product [Pieris macdunnoughi]|uniref:Uncharacterized protein n=1 Tax=Pieris macdunnoughi TaxID=345717 RepID=A0A821TA91_9NEOP|nr:unnamed protein product [Pieris macdunnoughi]